MAQGRKDWGEVYGQDPIDLLRKARPVAEDEYIDALLAKLKLKKQAFVRIEGSNGCVAWAYTPGGKPVKTGEDNLGQPLIRVEKGTVVLSWNSTMRSYKGRFFDFLAYVDEVGKQAITVE